MALIPSGRTSARFYCTVLTAALAVWLPRVTPAQEPQAEPGEKPAGSNALGKAEFQKMIDDAFKSRDDKKKKDDEEKKAKDEAEKQKKLAEGYAVGSDFKLNAVWKNGLYFETENKDFSIHAGATMQYDFTGFHADRLLETGNGGSGLYRDGATPRRGRVRLEGTIWENFDFLTEFEFVNGVTAAGAITNGAQAGNATFSGPSITDFYITIKKLPVVGNIRIGSQKEFISLEHLTSDRFLEFMERSPLFDLDPVTAFNAGFSPGIAFFNNDLFDNRLFVGSGVYKNVNNPYIFNAGNGQYATTSRVAGLPIYEEDGNYLLHLGTAYSHRSSVGGQAQVRIRDGLRQTVAVGGQLPNDINTGTFAASGQDVIAYEAAAVYGPLTIASEYIMTYYDNAQTAANRPNQGTVFFQGAYVEALLFLTGEHKPYNRTLFAWDRVVPTSPFFLVPGACCVGTGAWELGIRYSYADASNKTIQGGRLDELTVGLNWYLNGNMKMQFNYDLAKRGDIPTNGQGVVQGVGVGLRADF